MGVRLTPLSLAGLIGAAIIATGGSIAFAKGGHGGGHGRGHAHMSISRWHGLPPGWSRGRKVGWRGLGCPPGLAKQGRCQKSG
jgi:hypothetical protein